MLTLENHEFLLTPNSIQNFFNRSLLNNRYRRTSKRCFGSFIFLEQELANHRPWAKSNWFCIAYELKMNFIVLKGWGGGRQSIFCDLWKLYAIQIWGSICEVSFNYRHICSFCVSWAWFQATRAEVRSCDRNCVACKSETIYYQKIIANSWLRMTFYVNVKNNFSGAPERVVLKDFGMARPKCVRFRNYLEEILWLQESR